MNFTEQEQDYYELILDMLDDGTIDESERALLNKRISKYGISDERAKEIEDFALQEIQNKNKPKFNTEGEEEYYELLEDMLDDGTIDKSERSLLNKRKVKYNVSDKRAKEFEDYIKSVKVNNYTILNSYNNNAYDLFKQGEVYYNDKNYEEAIKCFKKSAELEPNDWYNWNWLGNTYNKNGNYEEAIKCLKKAVELSPDNWSNWYLLGISYNENGNYEEAIRCFNKSIELDPNAWINWNWLGASYNKNGNYKEAIRCLNKAVELKPDDQSNWRWLGRSYNGNGEYEEAIRCLKKAVELNPDNANNWEWLGNSYNKNGKFKEAQNAYAKALEIEPDNDYYKKQFKLNEDKANRK
ncbi:tetratricopeptide repeat protein [uncultured Brachyspira sp.]|uniref:tetratricopeptide repeat protein n=1 Tax=uncultured Brachyspira sp. TaxID=221953 RepID=UPI0026030120|nr:tetratricopeptide repeat protein [uncultured Brachyspira sp.]